MVRPYVKFAQYGVHSN